MEASYEELGKFYLGKKYDLTNRKLQEELVCYDAKDLTTHALCVGMTGSGKTGLCLALLEEAAIAGIPSKLHHAIGNAMEKTCGQWSMELALHSCKTSWAKIRLAIRP